MSRLFFRYKKSVFDEQRVKLITHLSMMVIVITLAYWLLDFIVVTQVPNFIFIACLSVGLITLILNKLGHHRSAAIFGLIVFNIAMYCVASSESTQTGMHMYLGTAAFAALVIFGYEEWYLGLIFLTFSLILYLCCFFLDYSPFPERTFTDSQISRFFVINAISFAAICAYLFYLVLWINHKNESSLHESKNQIKLQNEQLLKTNHELDRFVYSASHDLRAPLSSIAGLINLTELSQDLAEVKDYLTMMKGRIKTLDKFITEIINYSRNARTELNLEKVDLQFLVNETVDNLKFTEGGDQISFKIEIAENSEIVTDPTRLKIVLNNLVANAIRYHDKFKSEKFIQIDLEKKESEVAIHISDNGQGILPEHHEKIFTMFYKASSTLSGSGLGLYIASETVAKLGGDISVVSEYGKGSTFSVILPA